MLFSCLSYNCLTEQLHSITKLFLQAKCIVCVISSLGVAAAQWGSDLVIKLAKPSQRVSQPILLQVILTQLGLMLGVIIVLQNEIIPNQLLPRQNGIPLQFEVVFALIQEALNTVQIPNCLC